VPATSVASRQVGRVVKMHGQFMDLIPEDVFYATYGKTPSQLKLPMISVPRADGAIVTGVLTRAKEWNPPEGVYRLSPS
jgi:hypothetical protein